MKKRIITGIQPSGRLHIGNYFGVIQPFIKAKSEDVEPMLFIADYHALTTTPSKIDLEKRRNDLALDLIALTHKDHNDTIFMQSDVPSVCELATILSNVIGTGLLERNHAYKEKMAPTVGLFNYPLLMAADILLYDADIVPVGRDQIQHLEIARDIAQAFNFRYGKTLKEPIGLSNLQDTNLQDTIIGLDGRKMSKSYNNTLLVFEELKELRKKIMGITMATGPLEYPDENFLFQLFKLFKSHEADDIRQAFITDGVQYGPFKEEMVELITNYFSEIVLVRNDLENSVLGIRKAKEILHLGCLRARAIAKETIGKVRGAIGLNA